MLVQFKIKNFLSIKDEQVFSMVADTAIKEKGMDDKGAVIKVNSNLNLLKSAVVYGANASGKSNFIRAFTAYQAMIYESANFNELNDLYFIAPYLFDAKSSSEPSSFEAVIMQNNIQYRYGFEAGPKGITEEWLYVKIQRETEVFYRTSRETKINPKYKILNEINDKKMLHNKSLLISKGAVFNDEISSQIVKWASNLFTVSALNNHYVNISTEMVRDPTRRDKIVELMKLADFGITNLEVEQRDGTNFDVNFQPLSSGITNLPEVKQQKTKVSILHSIKVVKNAKGEIVGEMKVPFMAHESEGTKQFFGMIGAILVALEYGFVMVIDEMDVKLHPLLSQRLVSLFNSKETNPKGAQLIFATHDTNLLDAHLFRRDQIWFTEKDQQGATTLYPLTDYKPRNDAALEKNYIAGKYGAIPYLGDFDLLVKGLFVSKKSAKKKK